MIKLGVNSVLFDGFDFATAAQQIARAGFDGIELSAIKGMCEHLELERWRSQAAEIKKIASDNGLELLSMEQSRLEEERHLLAFEAAAELGIPVVNTGPGDGAEGNEDDLKRAIETLARIAERAEGFGVTLCCKAHVNKPIYNTPTTLRAMGEISAKGFGVDMDPSHIYRAGENPEEALPKVLSRVRHIHIRDCKGRERGPGSPPMQACGRGDIDLAGYCKVLVDGNYDGPVCLEVIGAKKAGLDLPQCAIIAAESYGYLNACLKTLGAR